MSTTPPATVTWRFGTNAHVDLTFPAEPRPVSEIDRWSRYTRAAFGTPTVAFAHQRSLGRAGSRRPEAPPPASPG